MTNNNLQVYLSNEKIIYELAEQLRKDIGIDEFELIAPAVSADTFNLLYFQLFPLIEKLQKVSPAKLRLIINRCDISESQLKKELNKKSAKSYAACLTELVIKRVLQKVVIRNMHR